MQRVENIKAPSVENVEFATDSTSRITGSQDWMPVSGYGQYFTIPLSSGIDGAMLVACALPSFPGARREIQVLAEEYAGRAATLVAKAEQERLQLSREVRGPDGALLIRPYRLRLRLHLDLSRGYLYLSWRAPVKKRGHWTRVRARMWDCTSDVTPLIANVHPAEEVLVRRIEAEAADIRRRWFALVRLVHYMNVAEDHRLSDLEAGRVHMGHAKEDGSAVMRKLRRLFRWRVHKS